MHTFTLWENESFTISTPKNPHLSYNEGAHIIVTPKQKVANAWTDLDVSAAAFQLASRVCQILGDMQFAPWFNIQANGNWGLLPGGQPFFHIHIYCRNKTDSWGKPVTLPEAPGTYQNDPMPDNDRTRLIHAFQSSLISY